MYQNAEAFLWDESDNYLLDQTDSQNYPGYGSVLESANYLWINNIMARGCQIIDLGHDVDRVEGKYKYGNPIYGKWGDPGNPTYPYFYHAELEWSVGYLNRISAPYKGSSSLGL